jgi:ribosomal protein S18 acetylase RimI-like enzyme
LDLRPATRDDLPAVVRLLADDPLGATRERPEDPLPQAYLDAFAAMERQAGNSLIVAVEDGAVIGCLQLVLVPGLSRQGAIQAQIVGVRVRRDRRDAGIGTALVRHAIDVARSQGCRLVGLTTHASRTDAHRFYERLGFVSSHVGMKLEL